MAHPEIIEMFGFINLNVLLKKETKKSQMSTIFFYMLILIVRTIVEIPGPYVLGVFGVVKNLQAFLLHFY
jgi:hypothetical protein